MKPGKTELRLNAEIEKRGALFAVLLDPDTSDEAAFVKAGAMAAANGADAAVAKPFPIVSSACMYAPPDGRGVFLTDSVKNLSVSLFFSCNWPRLPLIYKPHGVTQATFGDKDRRTI